MELEMKALHQNGTWELVPLLPGTHTVDCKWVYTIKFNSDDSIEILKACLVAKCYTQPYGIDYGETFLQLPKFIMFMYLFYWLLILICPYFNWISKIPFYMRTYMRKFKWSNHFGLLLRRSVRVVLVC
jgi:hypothetical protein